MKNIWFFETPIGTLGIAENDGVICNILFGREKSLSGFELCETPGIKLAVNQLHEYFDGKRMVFDFPMNPKGTEFQRSVWNALIAIPVGETRTYKEIAEQVGNSKAVRAVGMANNRNPIPIVIPCHRVIGSDGGLTGYAGGLPMKQYLLDLEKSYV